jgi:pyruvate kinase
VEIGFRQPGAGTVTGMPMSSTTRLGNAEGMAIDAVVAEMRALRDDVHGAACDDRGGDENPSVVNMRAYLALRRHDNRELQAALARLGLSSLGRSEGHVLATLEQVLAILERMASDAPTAAGPFAESRALLSRRVEALFGPGPTNRETRIMVTLPSEAASDDDLIRSLVGAGMDCARINSAHDDLTAWRAMASRVRAASEAAGRRVPILVDLPGPKLRTGPITPGPEVVHLHPRHDEVGAVVAPARAWLASRGAGGVPPDAGIVLPVEQEWLEALAPGDRVHFTDARGRYRTLRVGAGSRDGRWVETTHGAYLVSGTVLSTASAGETRLGRLPARGSFIPLAAGDTLLLTRDQGPGAPATGASPARIPCTLPEAFDAASVGDAVWLDDGKFGGTVRSVTPDTIEVELTHAPPSGGRLRAEKGINLPDTSLSVDASSDTGERIAFAVAHADMIGLSFVSTSDDVRAVTEALARSGGDHLGMILKIETRAGFDALPQLLAEALRRDAPCGVMIARGDLAIEVGWERMAEVQEEILWLCESAHVPVIWATQVLDTLARTGIASRAEITDAASGARAECVMLNKGPMILAAMATLDDILARMATHRHKKTSLLRQLHAWSPEPPA